MRQTELAAASLSYTVGCRCAMPSCITSCVYRWLTSCHVISVVRQQANRRAQGAMLACSHAQGNHLDPSTLACAQRPGRIEGWFSPSSVAKRRPCSSRALKKWKLAAPHPWQRAKACQRKACRHQRPPLKATFQPILPPPLPARQLARRALCQRQPRNCRSMTAQVTRSTMTTTWARR